MEYDIVEDLFGEFVPEDGGDLDAVECNKKASHGNFIPVLDFKLQDLPVEYREEDIHRRILIWAELTVKVLVKFVSHSRPEYYAGTTAKFPNFALRGSKRKTTPGSGYVHSIPPLEDIDTTKECHCLDCLKQGQPQTKSWYFTVVTSIHVVFDSSEAARSIFECFYDSDETRSETVKCLYGLCIYPQTACDNEKMSFVICVTHDEDLATRLQDLVKKREKFVKNSVAASTGPTVLISHPHGCSKRITCGRVLHLTIPPGLEHNYPVNKPVAFEEETECILPYGLLSQDLVAVLAEAHGIDPSSMLPSDVTDLNSGSNPVTESHEPCIEKEVDKETMIEDDASSASKPITKLCCDSAFPQQQTSQAHPDTTTHTDPSATEKSCLEVTGNSLSFPSPLGKCIPNCEEKGSDSSLCAGENLDIKELTGDPKFAKLSEPNAENSSSSSNLSGPVNSSTSPQTRLVGDSPDPSPIPITDDSEIEDKTAAVDEMKPDNSHTSTNDTEPFCMYNIEDLTSESLKDSLPPPDHLVSLALPSKITFTLPGDAKFARRYDIMKALFQLPSNTRFHLADGREVSIPQEALFYCNRVTLENGYMRYKIDSCPGSSGGCLMLDGGNSFFNSFPHGGSLPDSTSMCAMRCFPVMPSAL